MYERPGKRNLVRTVDIKAVPDIAAAQAVFSVAQQVLSVSVLRVISPKAPS